MIIKIRIQTKTRQNTNCRKNLLLAQMLSYQTALNLKWKCISHSPVSPISRYNYRLIRSKSKCCKLGTFKYSFYYTNAVIFLTVHHLNMAHYTLLERLLFLRYLASEGLLFLSLISPVIWHYSHIRKVTLVFLFWLY